MRKELLIQVGRGRAARLSTVLAATALAACDSGEAPADSERERTRPGAADARTSNARVAAGAPRSAGGKLLRLERTEVGWRRLGKGFVAKGIPLTAQIGRNGTLKAKAVVTAPTAQRLGLWPNPQKMKDRSVAKAKIKVRKGQRRTVLLKPHDEYKPDFRQAGRKALRNAKYELRAVLRDRKGRKVARKAKPIDVD